MKTCVSINCPFINFCKDYNLKLDRETGCTTKSKIVAAAAASKFLDAREAKHG